MRGVFNSNTMRIKVFAEGEVLIYAQCDTLR